MKRVKDIDENGGGLGGGGWNKVDTVVKRRIDPVTIRQTSVTDFPKKYQ